ncbi:peptide release factor [Schizosaccharomyces cryophilus OY26]|uniref:Peptide release factor n=1 Tax=Schizosaccharomyces cryophilus (strain OY26 / ATCC MYA-4695 / CBS 11777 / NBRC 106824 / NRRL Y48691) TaxID=653667 RepID=S9W194_SCHCR|nr:peptide release factor [Schizosaccharomyces cryophilus OY26]EPY53773.1 peptide release factor [Schizosaccharomyces cryophilus OY26]
MISTLRLFQFPFRMGRILFFQAMEPIPKRGNLYSFRQNSCQYPWMSRQFQISASSQTQKTKKPYFLEKINEEEVEEVFVRGSGPGGQKINKTSIVSQLRHIPTGITVRCQETRSREQNRKIARKRLAEKVDEFYHGENSLLSLKAQKIVQRKRNRQKKSRRKYGLEKDKGQIWNDESSSESPNEQSKVEN